MKENDRGSDQIVGGWTFYVCVLSFLVYLWTSHAVSTFVVKDTFHIVASWVSVLAQVQ